jgi:hypothetical protein
LLQSISNVFTTRLTMALERVKVKGWRERPFERLECPSELAECCHNQANIDIEGCGID